MLLRMLLKLILVDGIQILWGVIGLVCVCVKFSNRCCLKEIKGELISLQSSYCCCVHFVLFLGYRKQLKLCTKCKSMSRMYNVLWKMDCSIFWRYFVKGWFKKRDDSVKKKKREQGGNDFCCNRWSDNSPRMVEAINPQHPGWMKHFRLRTNFLIWINSPLFLLLYMYEGVALDLLCIIFFLYKEYFQLILIVNFPRLRCAPFRV